MSLYNQMFGIASSASFARCGGSGAHTRKVLSALASGFGANTGDGAYVHDLLAASNQENFWNGFTDSSPYYNTIEKNVTGLGEGYSRLGAASIIYAYANIENVLMESIVDCVNIYCGATKFLFGESYPPFSEDGLRHTMSKFSLSDVNGDLAGLEKKYTGKAINYNWYDSEPLFSDPNISSLARIIKDVENQYYYLSGELLYDTAAIDFPNCIEYPQSIVTPTGTLVFNVIANTPCYSQSSYIGPVSGVKFYRMFNDGPGSSGLFDSGTMAQYIKWDEKVLDKQDYSMNHPLLFSNVRDESGRYIYLINGQSIDTPGFFRSGNEYGVGHSNMITEGCTNHPAWPMMRMHQGDIGKKWYFESHQGTYPDTTCYYSSGLYDWTGWKMAPFSLKDDRDSLYDGVVANPQFDKARALKRALNLENYEGPLGAIHSPYANVTAEDASTLICDGVVGPPQLSDGEPTLPAFVFVQTFDNVTFPERASITIRAALLSGGSYIISNNDIFSTGLEGNFPVWGTPCQIPIFKVIPSTGLKDFDSITKKCLAIGDGFGGNGISGVSTPQSNAGHNYSGYVYLSGSGIAVSDSDLLNLFSSKIADKYSTIKYVSGYTGVGGDVYQLEDLYSFVSTGIDTGSTYSPGESLSYRYFPNGTLGAVNTGWSTFAPIPTGITNDPTSYGPILLQQKVENYLPRFDGGPYATYGHSFLYPNAQSGYDKFNAGVQGFPRKFFYEMSFKEETVREIYRKKNVSGPYDYMKVVRPKYPFWGQYGLYWETGEMETTMSQPFVPDDGLFTSQYSFDNTGLYPDSGSFYRDSKINDSMVDENYIPNSYLCNNPALNSTNYSTQDTVGYEGYNPDSPKQWACGVRAQRAIRDRVVYTGIGASGVVPFWEPLPKAIAWGYYGLKWTGTLDYELPLFNLESKRMEVSERLFNKFTGITYSRTGNTACWYTNKTHCFDGSNYGLLDGYDNASGQEPIFYENVGGRIGSGAEREGGNHSRGIVGDAWYDATVGSWGAYWSQKMCYHTDSDGDVQYNLRGPENDSHVFLLSLKPNVLEVYSKNLNYYPYYYNYEYKPFSSVISNIGVPTTARNVGGEYYHDFNLDSHFPLKTINSNRFYSDGLNIGPFDRDVELCVSSGNSLAVSGNLMVNDQWITLTDYNNGYDAMLATDLAQIKILDRVVPGEGIRSPYITTFRLIPKNTICNINISGVSGQTIGIGETATITVRPRLVFDSDLMKTYWGDVAIASRFGDASFLNAFRFIRNGLEQKFSIPFSTIANMNGKELSAQTISHETTYYPAPDSTDFYTFVPTGRDVLGNITYPDSPTKVYWQNKNPSVGTYSVRDVTRLRFKVNRFLESGLGEIPYQNQTVIIPEGNCTISGVFSYTGQAESAVLTNGIYLSGLSGASSLSGLFEPVYVSEVMERLPSGIFQLPSGSGYRPVLPAPSLMKQRRNYFSITGNDEYINASPYPNANYNAFLWPAWSDLGLLNPEVVYEQIPPEDGHIFPLSYLTFSAAQGQVMGNQSNIEEDVTYKVLACYEFVDSVSTNSIYNTGACIFSGQARKDTLHSGDLSGILTSEGNNLTMALNLVNFSQ